MHEPDPAHPSAERLRAFASGAVDDEELDGIAAHLDGCAACCAVVDGFFAENALLTHLQSAARPGGKVREDEAQRRRAARALQRGRFREPEGGAQAGPLTGPKFPPGGQTPSPSPPPDRTPHDRRSTAGGDAPEDDAPGERPLPGQVGEYDILAEVGRGGMGVVYKARRRGLHRLVALKVALSGPFASPAQRSRFRLEAELAARVRHPNVVQVYEVGTHEGRNFLTMEWVEGGTLADRLDGRPWPAAEAARLVETVARGVHGAHSQGVVHRDLKPGNILLAGGPGAPDFVPKIADFSLARPLQACTDLTKTGIVVGTPEYMAPEQAAGHGTPPGPAVDVYALGVVLYELLTGQVPFRGQSALEVLHAVSYTEPAPPRRLRPGVPRDLEAVALKCLEKDPGRRYASALELAVDLGRFLEGRPTAARPGRPAARGARWCGRNPGTATLLAALAAVLVAAFLLVTWKWREAEGKTRSLLLALEAERRARAQAEEHRQEGRHRPPGRERPACSPPGQRRADSAAATEPEPAQKKSSPPPFCPRR
jgi:tRNA A-37 threonylcarbamoyl transferase component Bud32